MLLVTDVTIFEFDAGRVPMKSLVDGRDTLTEGVLGAKTTEGLC